MGEVGVDEILDDLAQAGGQFGKGFEEFFIFHMERSKWIG